MLAEGIVLNANDFYSNFYFLANVLAHTQIFEFTASAVQ